MNVHQQRCTNGAPIRLPPAKHYAAPTPAPLNTAVLPEPLPDATVDVTPAVSPTMSPSSSSHPPRRRREPTDGECPVGQSRLSIGPATMSSPQIRQGRKPTSITAATRGESSSSVADNDASAPAYTVSTASDASAPACTMSTTNDASAPACEPLPTLEPDACEPLSTVPDAYDDRVPL
ncbi:hypothetical protein ACLOJK_029548 [Asimina triloba]